MKISQEQLQNLNELLEDTAEFYCNQFVVSGELFWTVVECFAAAKVAEMKGEVTSDA